MTYRDLRKQLYICSIYFALVCAFVLQVMPQHSFAESAKKKSKGPSQEPILRIETGQHISSIHRISVDNKCSLMVTGADDKTLRLWSLPSGQLMKTYRMPIGDGHHGKPYSVAMSPDGRMIAAGGWDAQYAEDYHMRIYLFDTISGKIVNRIGFMKGVITHLEFSRDGKYLGAVLGGKNGMRVWRTSDWQQVGSDKSYGGESYGATFGPDNSFYTTSYDGHLRKYSGAKFVLTRKIKLRSAERAYGISIDEAGRKVAVGYNYKSVVDVYKASDLSYMFTPDNAGVNQNTSSFISVAWSQDGKHLIAGGAYWDQSTKSRVFRVWGARGRGVGRNIRGTDHTIKSIVPCGPHFAVSATDPMFGLLSANGTEKLLWNDYPKADMRGKYDNVFTVSEDGTRLRFGLGYGGKTPILFDVITSSLTDAPDPVSDLYASDTKSLKITDWKHNFKPKLNNAVIPLDAYESSRSIAIRPDKQGFVLGANWSVRAYDRNAKQLWRFQAQSVPWGLNITRNGQIVVAALGDGSIRWHRVSDGKRLLSLFIDAKNRSWVAWTPKGYYSASPGGEDLIGWHINRDSWDKAADFFPGSRFRDKFYRPDIVKQVLLLLDEDEAISEANRLSKRKEGTDDLRRRLPPVINILNSTGDQEFSDQSVEIEYDIRSPSGFDVTKLNVLLDGRPLEHAKLQMASFPASGGSGRLRLTLPERDVRVALIAQTKYATSEAARMSFNWKGKPPRLQDADINKPKLYALLIGISDYQQEDYKLRYAAKDAQDFAQTLKAQEGGVYREVVIKSLLNDQATAGNIRDGLDWLEQEVTSRDVGLLFLAGHGITDLKQRFYYLPYDGDPKRLRRTAIPQSDIQSVISSLAGKALMFIDACHSAGSFGATTQTRGLSLVDINAVVNELSSAENGVVMFASSTGRQLSIEDSRWENGAFTEALLEGFNGKADYNRNNAISIAELDLWLSERVKQLTDKRQHPVARRPVTVPDFPIAITIQ